MAFCRKCGKEIDDDAVICVHGSTSQFADTYCRYHIVCCQERYTTKSGKDLSYNRCCHLGDLLYINDNTWFNVVENL